MSIFDDIKENIKPTTKVEMLLDEDQMLQHQGGQFKALQRLQHEIRAQMQADYQNASKTTPKIGFAVFKFSDGSEAGMTIVNGDVRSLRGQFISKEYGVSERSQASGVDAFQKLTQMRQTHRLEREQVNLLLPDGEQLDQFVLPSNSLYGRAATGWQLHLGHGIVERHLDLIGAKKDTITVDRFFKHKTFSSEPLNPSEFVARIKRQSQ